MKLVGRVPVEPLDDERMTNIERRIVAGAADAAVRPAHAPRRYVGFAMAAMAAVVTGVIGWQLGTRAETSAVVAEAAPIKVDTRTERASLDIGDAMIQSDPATVFVVTRPAGGVLVAMTRGKVELEVGKRGDRAPLIVRAGDTDVIVVGTHFTVDYGDGTGDVDVRVTEGVVKVVRHQQEVRVAAGSAWQSKRGLVAMADVGGIDGPSGATGARNPAGVNGAIGATGGAGATEPGDTIAANDPQKTGSGFEIDVGTAPDVLRNRTSQVPDTRTPNTRTGSNGSASTAANTRSGSGDSAVTTTTTVEPGPMNLRSLILSQKVEPALDVGKTGPAAIGAYQQIIREQDGAAQSQAFYSMALTQASPAMGRTGDALRTLDAYFQRFGGGKRYPEHRAALWLKLRIVCGKAIDDACQQVAARYAREYPDTPGAAIAERITLTQ